MSNEAGEKKIGADGGHFSEVPRLRKEILLILLHILLLGNYITLFLKLEPATIYERKENGSKRVICQKKNINTQ